MAIMAGSKCYRGPQDIPPRIPVFPLSGALLLPNGQMPLNIFEPRYIAMVDAALGGNRLIGMIQPELSEAETARSPALCRVGCAGRIVQFAEMGDGRYLITLSGVCRFAVVEEDEAPGTPYRQCRIAAEPFLDDFEPKKGEEAVDRAALLRTFRAYLDANGLEADWESVERASNAGLVTALSMMSPWGPAEKQALLEAPDHKSRASTLIAITEIALAGGEAGSSTRLQ
jgi:Lon protease-like protein